MQRSKKKTVFFVDKVDQNYILYSPEYLHFPLHLSISQPSECGRQRTLNIVPAQTVAQQQSKGIYDTRMSGKCGEWRY